VTSLHMNPESSTIGQVVNADNIGFSHLAVVPPQVFPDSPRADGRIWGTSHPPLDLYGRVAGAWWSLLLRGTAARLLW
jgi:hypothetical protein